MVTPFPQIVCTQAMLNVVGSERYGNVTDQCIRYVLGRFGRPTGQVDQNVLDRIHGLPRTKEIQSQPEKMELKEVRKRFSKDMSDEEFLLRAVMPQDQVDAMVAKRRPPRPYNPEVVPILKLLRELAARPPARRIQIDKPGFRLSLKSDQAG
jgi:oxaloacetate decarboxylase alpha subunit